MTNETFYFIAHPSGDKKRLTVIDLSYSVSYQRSDWDVISDKNYANLQEAISQCRNLSRLNRKEYQLFESRYDDSLDEKEELIEADTSKSKDVNLYLKSLRTDEERTNAIFEMLQGICYHCGEVTDRCYCTYDNLKD